MSTQSDNYGAGIRASFYLQWFGIIIAGQVAEYELHPLRLLNLLYVAAVCLAALIQAVSVELTAVDVYIILLLVSGAFYFLVPLYAWRLLTRCRSDWDPLRWTRAPRSGLLDGASSVLLVVVSCFQIWFWGAGVEGATLAGAAAEGFLFSGIALNNPGFVAGNIILHVTILLCCVGLLCAKCGIVKVRRRKRRRSRILASQLAALRQLHTAFNLTVAATVITAVELTLQWNGLTAEMADASTPAQLIPLIISAAAVLRVLWLSVIGRGDGDGDGGSDESGSSSHSGSHSTSRTGTGSGSSGGSGSRRKRERQSSEGSGGSGGSRSGASSASPVHDAAQGPFAASGGYVPAMPVFPPGVAVPAFNGGLAGVRMPFSGPMGARMPIFP